MIETVAKAAEPRRPVANPGLITRLLTLGAQAVKWLLLSLVFSIVMEWIGMHWWWPEQGVRHSQQMLATELSYLEADFHRSLLTAEPVVFAQTAVDRSHHLLFKVSGFDTVRAWLTPAPHEGEPGIRPRLHYLYRSASAYIEAGLSIALVFTVRLSVLLLAMPVFILFAGVGLVDGLVQRDLRRWGGGRESAFLYHYAKIALLPLIVASWVIYLAMPISLHPSWIILPFAGLLGSVTAITASTFKKYL